VAGALAGSRGAVARPVPGTITGPWSRRRQLGEPSLLPPGAIAGGVVHTPLAIPGRCPAGETHQGLTPSLAGGARRAETRRVAVGTPGRGLSPDHRPPRLLLDTFDELSRDFSPAAAPPPVGRRRRGCRLRVTTTPAPGPPKKSASALSFRAVAAGVRNGEARRRPPRPSLQAKHRWDGPLRRRQNQGA
jgi:hypothetical protein